MEKDINDPLGQTHSLASGDSCFLLFCFARFEKWGRTDGRTDNMCNDPYLPWLLVCRVDQKGRRETRLPLYHKMRPIFYNQLQATFFWSIRPTHDHGWKWSQLSQMLSVRPSPLCAKQNNFQVSIVIAASGFVGLAEGIINSKLLHF